MTACALSATCSLTRMLETWFLTVFRLTKSRPAISWLLLPCATRERISSSRSVSSGKARWVRRARDGKEAYDALGHPWPEDGFPARHRPDGVHYPLASGVL